MATSLLTPPWTYERLLIELPAAHIHEIYNGHLQPMSPAPSAYHQDIVGNFYTLLRQYLKANKVGKAYIAPVDVLLDGTTVLQPDVLLLLGDPARRINGPIRQVPELVVEVISPSSLHVDTVRKYELYARYGVAEYWIIAPSLENIQVYTLAGGSYTLHQELSDGGTATSVLLPGFEVALGELFEG